MNSARVPNLDKSLNIKNSLKSLKALENNFGNF